MRKRVPGSTPGHALQIQSLLYGKIKICQDSWRFSKLAKDLSQQPKICDHNIEGTMEEVMGEMEGKMVEETMGDEAMREMMEEKNRYETQGPSLFPSWLTMIC